MRRSRSSRQAPGLALALAVGAGCAHAPTPARCPREVTIASQDDVSAVRACASVGRVAIRTGAPLEVSAWPLEVVHGDVVVGPTSALDVLTLGALRQVDGAIVIVGNTNVHGVYFPALERVGRIEIRGNAALSSIGLPRLAVVSGGVTIEGNHDLEIVGAAQLRTIGGELVVADQPELALIELPELSALGSLRIDGASKVPEDVWAAMRARVP